ncbi:hypothetical protein LS70_003390 [Helicobacter sp. MIT 11-5569]|uniref:hypothetical protein n=1 Tax=Helicobacter sp. MIT 11-5569 TaxID=1548151 RepID=UPI0010FEFED3|nr:hypothetical protein [Helicobacter sp. MIT 11-5569]TLD84603.1 hypothetical protein LS70_003390 [Helicobacter sp. MIT 11-5569]
MKDEASMAIELEGKFFSITNRSLKRYFSIPKKLSSLSNDILLWMYKNNIVTMMKKDKIL